MVPQKYPLMVEDIIDVPKASPGFLTELKGTHQKVVTTDPASRW